MPPSSNGQEAWADRMWRRSRVIGAVRNYLFGQGFLEVDTPVALSSVAPEPHIDAPSVVLHAGADSGQRFLQTSPELPMKRLLARGLPKIFQIAAAFRDGDSSPIHRPEFRILEWYRRGASWETLLADCEALLATAAEACGTGPVLEYGGASVDLRPPFRRMTVDDAFAEHAGFSILMTLDKASLAERLKRLNIDHLPSDSWDDLFHRVFLSRIEPELQRDPNPLFLTHYPAPLAALARFSPDDPRTAERFELFAGGLELANGFGELTDTGEQRRRFAQDAERRRMMGKTDYPPDERFLAALERLPPSAGIALGLDRLLLLLLGGTDLDEVAFIPWSQT